LTCGALEAHPFSRFIKHDRRRSSVHDLSALLCITSNALKKAETVVPSNDARDSSSVTRNGESVDKRRFNVVRGIPVRVDASRWVIPDEMRHSLTMRPIERDCCALVSIGSKVVPKWNKCKDRSWRVAVKMFLDGYPMYQIRVYLIYMATGAREPSDFSFTVAAQIRAERAAAKLTGAEMIEASGIKRSTYLRIESGSHVADTTQIARICGVFGISLSDFFHRVEARMVAGSKNGTSN